MDNGARVREVLEGKGPFVLLTHRRPDGDALGSMLGLAMWLEGRGTSCTAVSPVGAPEPYGFLPGAGGLAARVPPELDGFIAVFLDTPDASRADVSPDELARARQTVNIDHHPDNTRFGDLNLVDPTASSVALIIHEILSSTGDVSPDIATALYTGVMTDTGGFRFGNTDARTLTAAADLVALGATPARVATAVFGEQPLGALRLLGSVLSSTRTELDGRLAVSVLTTEMKQEAGSTGAEIEGLASFGRLVRGVEVAVLLREENGGVRASLRSRGSVDVNAVARRLGGGGHASAAGVTFEGSLESARAKLVAAVSQELTERSV